MIDLLAEVRAGQDGEAPPKSEREAELIPREAPYLVRYRCPDGVRREGVLVFRVFDRDQRAAVARAAAHLARTTWAFLPTAEQVRFYALAWVGKLLLDQPETPPPWLLQALEEDDGFLLRIYGEVRAHSARYFRGDAGADGADPAESLVEVVRLGAAPAEAEQG